jgi:hypothetical protein
LPGEVEDEPTGAILITKDSKTTSHRNTTNDDDEDEDNEDQD